MRDVCVGAYIRAACLTFNREMTNLTSYKLGYERRLQHASRDKSANDVL